jgi:hypothetical protein
MKHVLLTLAVIGVTASCFAREVTGKSYTFDIPDNVKFEFKDSSMEFYTFNLGEPPDIGLFMLYASPMPMSEAMMKPMTDMMLVSFKEQMKKKPGMELVSSNQKPLDAGRFSGVEIEFILKADPGIEMKQYMFLLRDGDQGWNGQLTASSTNDLSVVKAILKSARK